MNFIWSNKSDNSRKRDVLGITTRATVDNIQWLRDFVRMEFPHVEVKYIPIYNYNRYPWEEEVRRCSAVILYHSNTHRRLNVTDVPGALYDDELCFLNSTPGREKVVVLLDDMKKTDEEEKRRILESQPSLLSFYLILIPENNKPQAVQRKLTEFIAALPGNVKTSQKDGFFPKLWSSLSGDSEHGDFLSRSSGAQSKPWSPPPTYHISIFSRSADSCYSWLTEILREKDDKTNVDVHPVYVSNKYEMFSSALRTCQFGILYHSQNQGRLNITDVPDSLYDCELQDMSSYLGKENVIVVVDDLKSNISEAKERILKNQPSIQKLARDLFVFSEKEKYTSNLERIRNIIQTNLSQLQTNYRAVAPSKINHGYSLDSGKNKKQQKQLSSQDSLHYSSASADCQSTSLKHDDAEPQSKKSRTATQTRSNDNNSDLPINQEEINKKRIHDIEKRERELQDMEEKLDKREKKIVERERNVDEQEKKIEERERNVVGQEEKIWERERDVVGQEEKIWERERDVVWQEENIGERERNVVGQEENIGERERNVVGQEKKIQERERNVDGQEEKVRERERNDDERQKKILEREVDEQLQMVRERERNDDERLQKIRERERNVVGQEKKIQERERNVVGQEEKILERERNVDEQIQKIREREKNVDEQEKKIRERERKVDEKLQKIQERERNVDEQLQKIRERERNVDEQLQKIRKRERNVDEREKKVRVRERNVDEREKKVRVRERYDDEQLQKIRENPTNLQTTTKMDRVTEDIQNMCMGYRCKCQQDEKAQQKRGVSPQSSHMN